MKLLLGTGLVSLSLASPICAETYPAAYFQPKIIYSADQAESQNISSKLKKAEDMAEYDPKYPAANFRPKVIYLSPNPSASDR
ncbi:hypothetical protein [Methylomonas albis]|uniref:Uncharacterized protein n=1 Tax=Methylomonas albis TaxID=1854563 RepID=A0ABR9D6H3_9GAMM|nr:hypothetical protein [Methylomonas albis]MBD9358668.1 hypothetical protein [Methylomonas albis]